MIITITSGVNDGDGTIISLMPYNTDYCFVHTYLEFFNYILSRLKEILVRKKVSVRESGIVKIIPKL